MRTHNNSNYKNSRIFSPLWSLTKRVLWSMRHEFGGLIHVQESMKLHTYVILTCLELYWYAWGLNLYMYMCLLLSSCSQQKTRKLGCLTLIGKLCRGGNCVQLLKQRPIQPQGKSMAFTSLQRGQDLSPPPSACFPKGRLMRALEKKSSCSVYNVVEVSIYLFFFSFRVRNPQN